MNIVSASAVILKLLPIIGNAVRAVEELEQTPGKGPAKLQVVLGVVRSIYEAAEPDSTVKFDAVVQSVTAIVANLVTFYNNIGVFKKAAQS